MSHLNFGDALAAAKHGNRIARAGWNGKGMFVWVEHGSAPDRAEWNGGVSGALFQQGDAGTNVSMPHFRMRAADGSTVVGWLASQTDLLAEDWVALPDEAPVA